MSKPLDSGWTLPDTKQRYERLRDYLMRQEPLDLDLYGDLVRLYVQATSRHIGDDAYDELARVFRERLAEMEKVVSRA